VETQSTSRPQCGAGRDPSWGIQGVPFYVFEEKYAISGAQPVSAFGAALDQVWAELSPAPQPLG
jgi:predicted DsbA family dithiol-disulfide isomerase